MRHTYEAWAIQRVDGALWDGISDETESRTNAHIPTWTHYIETMKQRECDTDIPVRVRVTIETLDEATANPTGEVRE